MKMHHETFSETEIDGIFPALRNQVQRNLVSVKKILCIITCFLLKEVNETLIVLVGESSDVETPTETLQMLINECSEDKTKQNWTIIRSLLKNSNGKKLNAKGVSLHHGMNYGMQLDELKTLIFLGADVNEYDSVNSKSILSKMLNEKLYEQAAMLIYHRALLHPNIKDTGAPVSPPFIVALLCSLQIGRDRYSFRFLKPSLIKRCF